MRGQLGGDVDSGGAVRTADDADRTGLLVRKAQDLSADEGEEDAQLCGSASSRLDGRAISGSKSVIVPMPRKISAVDAQLNA